ncbi:MAG: hypothetical protein ACRENB_02660, partial [Gemmatimonadales bacterium]
MSPSPAGSSSSVSTRLPLLLLLIGLAACEQRTSDALPADLLPSLERLAAAGARHDSAMRAFARDLEAWSAKAGHPEPAEALLGPLFLHPPRNHRPVLASDTGIVADYRRLEARFAELLATRDSLRQAALAWRDPLVRYAQAHRSGDSARTLMRTT